MGMSIEVEFLAGTEIREALEEAKSKAVLLGMSYVKFRFNNVNFSISPRADIDECMRQWDKEVNHKYEPHIIA